MHEDYYQNTLYPLQDKVLEIVGKLPVGFYLTGGTALSRAYLHHRYSDDLDFFVNDEPDFKSQVNIIIKALADNSPKDVVDIVYIREILSFNWENILNDASEKDLWVNPINVAEVLEQFPMEKLQEVVWRVEVPPSEWFADRIKQIITGILDGSENIPNQ